MSKLFAFNVSEVAAAASQEGKYDTTAQLWVGDGYAIADEVGTDCLESAFRCEVVRREYKNEFGCAVTPCYEVCGILWCVDFVCSHPNSR